LPLIFSPIEGIPIIKPHEDLGVVLIKAFERSRVSVTTGDIVVITQKIVSKSENRFRYLGDIVPSKRAAIIARKTKKDPRLVELILGESKAVVRAEEGVLIVEHKNGFICANAGIDHSNVLEHTEKRKECYLLLPEKPDLSANRIIRVLEEFYDAKLGVLIIDSHGRPWRKGTVGVSIGISGFSPIADLRGKEDLYGNRLRITQIGVADEIAAGASIVMGQASERLPVVHVRGYPYQLGEGKTSNLLRDEKEDLFR